MLDEILGQMAVAQTFQSSANLDDKTVEAVVNFIEIDQKTNGMFFILELFIEKTSGDKNPVGSRASIKLNLSNVKNQSRMSLLKEYMLGLVPYSKPEERAALDKNPEALKKLTAAACRTNAMAQKDGNTALPVQPLRGVRVRVDSDLRSKKKEEGQYTRHTITAFLQGAGNSKEEIAQRRAKLEAELGPTK